MVNLPTGVPVLGDFPLLPNTWYSVELYAEHFVPERNGTMVFALEEDIHWDQGEGEWRWVYGQQTEFHLIKSANEDGLRIQY